MAAIKKNSLLWYLFRGPVYLYRWGLGWLLGTRFVLITHIGRKTGLRRQTVLEVVEYRKEGPEIVVVSGFGADSDWFKNIEARGGEEVTVGSRHFAAIHRILGEEEAIQVLEGYDTATASCGRSSVQYCPGFSDGTTEVRRLIGVAW